MELLKVETNNNNVIREFAFSHKPIIPDLETPPGNSRLLHIIYCSTKMADGAADSIDTDISRLNENFEVELHYGGPQD